MMLFDANGMIVQDDFSENMAISYGYDDNGDTNYTVIRVFQTKKDGTKQFPFIRYPGFESAQMLYRTEGWPIIMNAGLGWDAEIDGVAIENGVVLHNPVASYHTGAIPLTIDASGTLGTALATETGSEILAKGGIVSATCGFCPLIINYTPCDSFPSCTPAESQRSIIGQFGNGDYALIVCAGRDLDNSKGWTLTEAIAVCQQLGLKFAYNFDGGKSSALYLHKHAIYDNSLGSFRIVPSFLVFNGTDTFSIPK